jgi:septal ring factor EnvC (AmiA/AmiB activator)
MGKMKKICAAILIIFSLASGRFALALSTVEASSVDSERTRLEAELRDVENEIAQFEKDLTKTQAEKDTLKRKIQQLKIKKSELVLLMKKTSLELERTEFNLDETQSAVDANEEKIGALREQITEVIKQLYAEGGKNLFIKLLLHGDRLSAIVGDLRYYEQITNELALLANEIHTRNDELKKQKQELAEDKEQQEHLVKIQNLQNRSLAENLSDQADLLTKTKGKEENYKVLLTDTKKRAQEIRVRIYRLVCFKNNRRPSGVFACNLNAGIKSREKRGDVQSRERPSGKELEGHYEAGSGPGPVREYRKRAWDSDGRHAGFLPHAREGRIPDRLGRGNGPGPVYSLDMDRI